MGCFESSPQTVVINGVKMELKPVKKDESFIAHHINHQLTLSPNTSSDYIRRRQILEHAYIETNSHRYLKEGCGIYFDFLVKGWFQRIFLQTIDQAQIEYFKQKRDYDLVRAKIADRYLFEYYQCTQYANASMAKVLNNSELFQELTITMSFFGFSSDSSLFQVLKELKSRFPQVADKSKIEFPDVKQLKQDVNLLDNIPNALSFSDPAYKNLNTTLFDMKFLFDRAINEFEDFKKDMKALLGDDVLTDAKVKGQMKGDQMQYNASAVRRVFIKWVETMLQRLPQITTSREYMDFLKAKCLIVDGFHIKSSGLRTSIQQTVVTVFLHLLQAMKYNMNSGKPVKNGKYGFFIYDLLRCKAVRKTPQQITDILAKLNSTTTTSTGKKFKVVRVKNRFKTPNRDLMVNFCYGDVIVAEAQLCVDNSDVDQKAKKTNKFNHYLYELERGILGPTIELMMQYQDLFVPGLQTKMYYEGMVQKRVKGVSAYCKPIERKCFADHQMIEVKENYFINPPAVDGQVLRSLPFTCDYCQQSSKMNELYHYCEKCGTFLCLKCNTPTEYQKAKKNWTPINIFFKVAEHQIQNEQQYYTAAKKKRASYVLFYQPQSSPSIVAKDFLVIIQALMKNLGHEQPPILYCDATQPSLRGLVQKYGIKKFPASLVIDQAGNLKKMLIGCSIYLMVSLDDFREQLEKTGGKTGALAYNCTNPLCQGCNSQPLSYQQIPEQFQETTCFNCLDKDIKDQGFMSSLFKQTDKKTAHVCPKCKQFYCNDCCFLSYDQPSVYQDPLGASYLSSRINQFKQTNCPNQHPFKYIHKNVYKQTNYDCSLCNKNFFFSEQDGMGQCEQCSLFCCPQCIGVNVSTLQSKQHELVNHFALSPAFECNRCIGCKGDLYKMYKGRVLLMKRAKKHKQKMELKQAERELQKHDPDADSDIQAIGNFFEDIADAMDDPQIDMENPIQRMKGLLDNENWRCVACNKKRDSTILHFGCFTCNYEICFECMAKYGFFKHPKKSFEQYKLNEDCGDCGQGNKFMITQRNAQKQATKVDCGKCHRAYYPNSTHLSCEKCNSFYCLRCTTEAIRSDTFNSCDLMHPLVPRGKNPIQRQIFCKKRLHFINPNEEYYSCAICENYCVCNTQLECRIENENQNIKCKLGHQLQQFEDMDQECKVCGFFPSGSLYGCEECDWYSCQSCVIDTRPRS